ncbi:helicase associated domain-containing protein [uncultured Microscilla sp.]|uniref:helicase associated domain-containing protein n=1 Tax=uncultured Microscilla sp. TaxID=432653 RepID=UPI00261E3997|nr:helicase associated domain-containing protein [uncultured Microscilla sp.]
MKLSRWESKQRGRRKQGKLSKKRIELLDSIGFSWSLKGKRLSLPVYDYLWNERFAKLKIFQAEHGHCNPSKSRKRKLWDIVFFSKRKGSEEDNLPNISLTY